MSDPGLFCVTETQDCDWKGFQQSSFDRILELLCEEYNRGRPRRNWETSEE
jgi:hypothetical protein